MLPAPLAFLVTSLPATALAVRSLPLRRARERLHEGVVDAAAQVRVDVVLGEGEGAVGLRGAGVDLAAKHHRFLQCGYAAGADRVVEQVYLGPHGATREHGGLQVGVEATRVRAQRGQQGRVGDVDGAGREATR